MLRDIEKVSDMLEEIFRECLTYWREWNVEKVGVYLWVCMRVRESVRVGGLVCVGVRVGVRVRVCMFV